MTPQAIAAIRHLPNILKAFLSFAPLVGKINEWLESPPEEGQTSGEERQDEHTAILTELRAQDTERLAILRDVNHKEEELIALYRQVRENENVLIAHRERLAAVNEAQSAHLATMAENMQTLIDLIEPMGKRRALLDNELAKWRRDGYSIKSQDDGEAIIHKGGLLNLLAADKRVTVDDLGVVKVEDIEE